MIQVKVDVGVRKNIENLRTNKVQGGVRRCPRNSNYYKWKIFFAFLVCLRFKLHLEFDTRQPWAWIIYYIPMAIQRIASNGTTFLLCHTIENCHNDVLIKFAEILWLEEHFQSIFSNLIESSIFLYKLWRREFYLTTKPQIVAINSNKTLYSNCAFRLLLWFECVKYFPISFMSTVWAKFSACICEQILCRLIDGVSSWQLPLE